MSPHLVAFVIFDFPVTSKDYHSVYAREQMMEEQRGDYALDVGVAIIEVLEDFLGITYPLDQLSQIAIPDQFWPGTQNWGLVTYSENKLVFKENVTTSSEKQIITTSVARKMAHQWFGGLVTCKWWSYFWLEKGFASYFEYYASSIVQPTERLMDQFLLEAVQISFENDGLEEAKPMTFDVQSSYEIVSFYDGLISDKKCMGVIHNTIIY